MVPGLFSGQSLVDENSILAAVRISIRIRCTDCSVVMGMGALVGLGYYGGDRDCVAGDEAIARRGILRLYRPVERGTIENWKDFEVILQHCFERELRITPEETPMLFSHFHDPSSPRERMKLSHVLFETFNVPALCLADPAVLAMYSHGVEEQTGISVDMGDEKIRVTSVYRGHAIPSTSKTLKLGGRDVVEYMVELLAEKGYEMTTSAEKAIVMDVKEKLCFVSLDYEEDLLTEEAVGQQFTDYELPDGSVLPVGSERYKAAEILFQPSIWKPDEKHHVAIPQLVAGCLADTDSEIRETVASHICVHGGTARFTGMKERLQNELTSVGKVQMLEAGERQFANWVGGSIFSSLSSFPRLCVTRQEFEEFGDLGSKEGREGIDDPWKGENSRIVLRKCF